MTRRVPITDDAHTPHPIPGGEALSGTVKSIQPDKGYGFVRAPDGVEYFFHRSSAYDFQLLQPGDAVTFVPTEGPKGPRAEHVERAERAEQPF